MPYALFDHATPDKAPQIYPMPRATEQRKPTGVVLTWYIGVMPVPPAIMDRRSTDLPAPSSMYLINTHVCKVYVPVTRSAFVAAP